MQLSSPHFTHEGQIPSKYTCDGVNIHPELLISSIPDGAKSLALIMEDPDVPTSIREDGMWDHWIVWNIPPDTRILREGERPPGITGMNTRGMQDYGGPCPPDREHRYFFKLFALDAMLDLSASATKADLISAMEGHIVEQCELMGRYERIRV